MASSGSQLVERRHENRLCGSLSKVGHTLLLLDGVRKPCCISSKEDHSGLLLGRRDGRRNGRSKLLEDQTGKSFSCCQGMVKFTKGRLAIISNR